VSEGAYIRVAQRDLLLASVRYRGLLPACAVEDLGWKVCVGSGDELPPPNTSVVIVVKPLSERDAAWVRAVAGAGLPVVVDLCDNVFVDGYAGRGTEIGRRFSETCSVVDAVTVPTIGLRNIVIERTGLTSDRVLVVPDIVETASLLNRQRRLIQEEESWRDQLRNLLRRFTARRRRTRSLLWYGNHGASYANFGMDDLLLFHEGLTQAAEMGAELLVVSNNRQRFERLAARLPIRSRYFEWTPGIVDDLLPSAGVCLVPNSLDAFSLTKSTNRALKALSTGVPVVATPTPAYGDLQDAVWLGDPGQGILAYLNDEDLRRKHLGTAKAILDRRYSLAALTQSMAGVLEVAAKPRMRAA